MGVGLLKSIALPKKAKMLSPQCRQKMQDRSDLVQNGFLKREKAVIATIIGQFDTGQFDTADNLTPRTI